MPELTTLGGPIKSIYEGQTNTNAFTDAEKAKLANLSELASSGQWDDIEDKPALPALQRGNIGPAIPALRVALISEQSLANQVRTKITNWGGGYDQFGMRSGGDFLIPEWASYARVTCSVATQDLSAPNHLHIQVSRNSEIVATGSARGMDTANPPTARADTGIMGVSGGDIFQVLARHNYGSGRNAIIVGTMINIELFEAI